MNAARLAGLHIRLSGHQLRKYSRNIVKTLHERGMVQDVFPREKVPELVALLQKKPWGVYAGFDPTADSLHIGNLFVLMGLLHAQRSGHNVIALVGGATGRVGDPSGRSTERSLIDSNVLTSNVDGIKADILKIFDNHKKHFWTSGEGELSEVAIVNNEKWYSEMNIIDFLTSVGRHFRLGTMLSRHSVKSRLASSEGISFTEFTYQTFQAYDWLKLNKDAECLVQLGGSDQMGNIASGQELISRHLNKQVFGITLPLLVSASGDKFGKSSGTPVWLNSSRTSAFQLYQFLLRRPDSELDQLLRYFTFLPLGQIQDIINKHKGNPERRYGQEKLAEYVTLLIHGEEGLRLAQRSTNIIYKDDIRALANISSEDAKELFQQADYILKLYEPGITVADFAMKIGCFKKERDALRIIIAGGFYINQTRVVNPEEVLVHGVHILDNNLTLVRVGKKNYYIV